MKSTIQDIDPILLVRERLGTKCLSDMAEATGLSKSCLTSIRDGKTKWPRIPTFKKILPLLNLNLTIVDIKHD